MCCFGHEIMRIMACEDDSREPGVVCHGSGVHKEVGFAIPEEVDSQIWCDYVLFSSKKE